MMDKLRVVSEAEAFYLVNGKRLSSLYELKDELKKIDRKTFSQHVNKHKNDFANWVRDIIGDDLLAEAIASLDNEKDMYKAVKSRIKELEKSEGGKRKKNGKKIDYWNSFIDFALGVAVGFALALLFKSLF